MASQDSIPADFRRKMSRQEKEATDRRINGVGSERGREKDVSFHGMSTSFDWPLCLRAGVSMDK